MIRRAAAWVILTWFVVGGLAAEVRVKSVDTNTVEITFTYKDDVDAEMAVIGSFDNWTVPGEAMAKNAAGLWEKTIKVAATDEVQYKFYSKGTWIADTDAPDQKDDGYGGHNGLIVVADILSGAVPMKPAPAAAAGTTPAAANYGSHLNFGMYTYVGSQTFFTTQGLVDQSKKGLEVNSTGLYAKSYWKIDGTLFPGLTVFVNMNLANGFQTLWGQDATGKVNPDAGHGLANAGVGLLTNPINYLASGNSPSIDTVKFGYKTPVLNWETGYKYAKPDDHTGILWTTLYQQNANNGYMLFALPKDSGKLGDLSLQATVSPNMMTGNFGGFGWLSLGHPVFGKVEAVYDGKSTESKLVSKMFNAAAQQDFVLGYQYKVLGTELSVQGLMNQYQTTSFSAASHLSGEGKISWSLPNDVLGFTAGLRYTGTAANLMFGHMDDSFGVQGVERYLLNVWGKPVDSFKLGVDGAALVNTALVDSQGYEYYGKPWTEWNLKGLTGQDATWKGYVKTYYNFQSALQGNSINIATSNYFTPGSPSFQVVEAGTSYLWTNPLPGRVNRLNFNYGFDNWEANKVFHTLITSVGLPQNVNVDLGLGLILPRDSATQRIKDGNNYLAFSLQGSWKLPAPDLKNPTLIGGFVYNMDPYDSGNFQNLQMDDSVPDGGVAKSDGTAQLRVLMKWDF